MDQLWKVDDILAYIAELLAKRCFDNASKLYSTRIMLINLSDVRTFQNYVVAFCRIANINGPMTYQMIDATVGVDLVVYAGDLINATNMIINADAHILLKYAVELGYLNIVEEMHNIPTIWHKCAEYLYSNASTRDHIITYIQNIYESRYRQLNILYSNADRYIQLSRFVIENKIITHINNVICAMSIYKIGVSVIESFIAQYNCKYSEDLVNFIDINTDNGQYFRDVVDMYMRHFDQYEIFKDIATTYVYHIFVKEIFEKYDIANKITDKINVKNITNVDAAIYLMMRGVCELNDEFWDRFIGKKDTYRPHLKIDDETLRFFYNATDCSVCLSIKFVHACDDSAMKRALMGLHEYPLKLCDKCRDLRTKKIE